MNYIRHLTGFFDRVANDRLLNPTHISLYIALFQFWNCNRFKNPVSISRDEVMRISKICSKATYHKCLKALHEKGYIKYEPSYNPFRGSHVYLFNFSDDLKPGLKNERLADSNIEPVAKLVAGLSGTGTETGFKPVTKQVIVPSINNTNISNFKNLEDFANSLAFSDEEENPDPKKALVPPKEKSSAKKEMEAQAESESQPAMPPDDDCEHRSADRGHRPTQFINVNPEPTLTVFTDQTDFQIKPPAADGMVSPAPTFEEVANYFVRQNFPDVEANKFYNYFKSIGWLVGGRTPMADWEAAARNWMLNTNRYNTHESMNRARKFDASIEKDYSEPL
jgi:hypothetical protein